MSLIKCGECGHDVSDESKKCPNCGAKVHKKVGMIGWAFAAFLLFVMVKCAYQESVKPSPPEKSAAQIKADVENEAKFKLDMLRAMALRDSMKNPKSFELVKALRMEDGTLCVTYRATNSFNAIITDSKAISIKGALIDWNKYCANKYGEDQTKLKYGL